MKNTLQKTCLLLVQRCKGMQGAGCLAFLARRKRMRHVTLAFIASAVSVSGALRTTTADDSSFGMAGVGSVTVTTGVGGSQTITHMDLGHGNSTHPDRDVIIDNDGIPNNSLVESVTTVSSVGGDITVSNSFDSPTQLKGIDLILGAGVTSFTVSSTFSRDLHGIENNSQIFRPWMNSIDLETDGGGNPNFDVLITYSGIKTLLANSAMDQSVSGSQFFNGLAVDSSDLNPIYMTSFNNSVSNLTAAPVMLAASAGDTSISFSATHLGGVTGPSFLGLNGLQLNSGVTGRAVANGTSNASSEDDILDAREQISATTISFTFTSTDTVNGFAEGTQFLSSFDGRMGEEVAIALEATAPVATPEPSGILMVLSGSLCFLFKRRRG